MVELGAACLAAALITLLCGAGLAIRGALTSDRRLVISARRCVYSTCALLTIAVVILELAFLRDDFSVALVADHSSTTTPLGYKLTAMWSSQGGSLLLWAWVLSIASSAALWANRDRNREVVPWATAVLCGIGAFFCALMLFADGANPFERLSPVPAEGAGLNPLLRHPAMAIHPPMLYSGYVFFSIPFAFAIGALISRRVDASWIRSTRRYALIAWIFLGIGILLGSRWSYSELGWGGYWGWDPVENASLMPWLIGTAFLHSVMVQERRGMLRVWNVSLIVATYALCLLGTFLVRSGILESIHAFGASTVGTPLLILIGCVLVGSTVLIISRLPDLRSKRRIESLASREAVFLINNLLLVGLCLVIFWGTFFPLISEAVTGDRSSLAAPWFNRYVTPLAILLVLFAGIGPMLAWRRVSAGALWRLLAWPVGITIAGVVGLALFTNAADDLGAMLMFACGIFALSALGQEVGKAALAQRRLSGAAFPVALGRTVARNRRRYGGYTAHAGIVILFCSVAASSSFQTSEDVRIRPGESAEVDDYTLTYVRPTSLISSEEERLTLGALIQVRRDGEEFATLHPSRNYYSGNADPTVGPLRGFFEGEATSEVGTTEAAGEDLWTAMRPDLTQFEPVIEEVDERLMAALPDDISPQGPTADQLAAMQAYADRQGQAISRLALVYTASALPIDLRVNVNPLVIWLWIGGAIAVLGGLIAVWPGGSGAPRRVSDVYAARLARDLGRA